MTHVSRTSQHGIVAVILAIAMLPLLGMMGLALDSGHLLLNKSRLQETVDAAALAAAKVLDTTGSQAQATTAAQSVFDLNAANFPELKGVISGANLVITYSNTLNPFVSPVPAGLSANYVRVVASGFKMWAGFVSLVGLNSLTTAASAVAGPSAPINQANACDVAPIMVCGDKTKPVTATSAYGYDSSKVTLLKVAAGTGSAVGPGNFQLIQVGGPGGADVRQAAAGTKSCLDGSNTVTTKPGNNVGPATQGFNTRFDQYQGPVNPTDDPPDVVYSPAHVTSLTTPDGINVYQAGKLVTDASQLNYSYFGKDGKGSDPSSSYQSDLATSSTWDNAKGTPGRRLVGVPIVDCSTIVNGQGTLNILPNGLGCFLLLQPLVQQGNKNYIFGQYVPGGSHGCPGDGAAGPAAGGSGLYKIVLHKDANSGDS